MSKSSVNFFKDSKLHVEIFTSSPNFIFRRSCLTTCPYNGATVEKKILSKNVVTCRRFNNRATGRKKRRYSSLINCMKKRKYKYCHRTYCRKINLQYSITTVLSHFIILYNTSVWNIVKILISSDSLVWQKFIVPIFFYLRFKLIFRKRQINRESDERWLINGELNFSRVGKYKSDSRCRKKCLLGGNVIFFIIVSI